MKASKYYKKAVMLLCYGAGVNKTAKESKLGLRVTRVIDKQLRSGTLLAYSDYRGRIYRGYAQC